MCTHRGEGLAQHGTRAMSACTAYPIPPSRRAVTAGWGLNVRPDSRCLKSELIYLFMGKSLGNANSALFLSGVKKRALIDCR